MPLPKASSKTSFARSIATVVASFMWTPFVLPMTETRKVQCGPRGRVATRGESISSFKPNLLRYTKAMAERACHGFGSTTQVGLTQALGRRHNTEVRTMLKGQLLVAL